MDSEETCCVPDQGHEIVVEKQDDSEPEQLVVSHEVSDGEHAVETKDCPSSADLIVFEEGSGNELIVEEFCEVTSVQVEVFKLEELTEITESEQVIVSDHDYTVLPALDDSLKKDAPEFHLEVANPDILCLENAPSDGGSGDSSFPQGSSDTLTPSVSVNELPQGAFEAGDCEITLPLDVVANPLDVVTNSPETVEDVVLPLSTRGELESNFVEELAIEVDFEVDINTSSKSPRITEGEQTPLEVLPVDEVAQPECHELVEDEPKVEDTPVPTESVAPLPANPTESDYLLLTRIDALMMKVEKSLQVVTENLEQDFDCIKKLFDEITSSHHNLLQQVNDNAVILKEILQSAAQVEDASKRSDLIDRLEACFNAPGLWVEKTVKGKLLTEAKGALKDFVSCKFGGVTKVRSLVSSYLSPAALPKEPSIASSSKKCDPFLVTVTAVVDPGEFYVVRWCDREEQNLLFSSIEAIVPTCAIPESIIEGQVYGILNGANKWLRGTAGRTCGMFQVGDNPPETLYEFFLPDSGHFERIGERNVRMLPSELINSRALARRCTLNANFKALRWSAEATALFKQFVRRSPMDMRVFSEEAGIYNVDLAQLPAFGEDGHIVSVRDALMLAHRPSPVIETPTKKYKPKYGQYQVKFEPLQHFAAIITSSTTPSQVYVQVQDEDLPRYRQMQQDLAVEFEGATAESESYSPSPSIGNAYAVRYRSEWYRVLVEMSPHENRLKIFYVDTGHRQEITEAIHLHKLPDRFMELPAQALRCVLSGVTPYSKPVSGYGRRNQRSPNTFRPELAPIMREYNHKSAVAFVDNWRSGDVGHLFKNGPSELTAHVILYVDGSKHSVNIEVGSCKYAQLTSRKLEYAEHHRIRAQIAAQHGTSAVPSTVVYPDRASSVEGSDATSVDQTKQLLIDLTDSAALGCQIATKCLRQELDLTSDSASEKIVSSFSYDLLDSASCAGEDVIPVHNAPEDRSGTPISFMGNAALSITPLLAPASFANSSSLIPNVLAGSPEFPSEMSTLNENLLVDVDVGIPPAPAAESEAVVVAFRGTQPYPDEISIPVRFVWCDSPHAIYFRTYEQRTQFDKLQIKLRNCLEGTKPIPIRKKNKIEVGFKCAVYCDFDWWRAEVVDVEQFPDCSVLLVDKGYKRKVDLGDIYRLPPDLECYPRMILCCSLFGVYPPSGSTWDRDVSAWISERMCGAERIQINRRGEPNKDSHVLSVMLTYVYDVEGGPLEMPGMTNINLNEELILLGKAKNSPSLGTVSPIRPVKPRAWISPEVPKMGSRFWALVTWINTKCEIFFQDVRSRPKVDAISQFLKEKYQDSRPTEADVLCNVGDLCIAKYGLDSMWYRATVNSFKDQHNVDVFFVDYGTLDETKIENIRLDVPLADIPVQAMRAVLTNIKPPGGADRWEIETLNEIHESIVDKEFRVFVKSRSIPIRVVMKNSKGCDLRDMLVEKGLADFIKEPKKKRATKRVK